MKIDAMIFDMDGVVYDSEKMYFAADQKAAQKLGFEFTFDYYKQFIGGGYDLMYNQMVADYGDPELIKRFLELSRDEILPVVKEGMLKFKPGFLDLARYLEDHHIPYGLASSNYREDIDFYLKETNVLYSVLAVSTLIDLSCDILLVFVASLLTYKLLPLIHKHKLANQLFIS